jgi:hypothetical protein
MAAPMSRVLSADIASGRLEAVFVELRAVMDWFSRYVRCWAVAIIKVGELCVEGLVYRTPAAVLRVPGRGCSHERQRTWQRRAHNKLPRRNFCGPTHPLDNEAHRQTRSRSHAASVTCIGVRSSNPRPLHKESTNLTRVEEVIETPGGLLYWNINR